MRFARTCLRLSLLVLAALVLAAAGCKDFNETFKNNTNRAMTRLVITVKVQGASSFPHASKFYNNQPPNRVDRTGGPDADGYYTYQLTYVFFPPVQPGASVHIGLTFDQDQTLKLVDYYFTFFNDAERKRLAGFSMIPRIDPQQGLVVDVSNDAAAPGAVTVSQLQWAVHSEYVALANLDWTDPVLGLLTWHDFTPDLPLTLAPGDVVTFDVPDGPMAGTTHALVRWIATDEQGLVSQQPVMEMEIQDLPAATVPPMTAVPPGH